MKVKLIDPPRFFDVGQGIRMRDCAHIHMEPDEQITLVTESGTEYDVARKSWGYYATPSLNGRLAQFGLRAVLVKSPVAKYYLFLVESGKDVDFLRYIDGAGHTIVCWLDGDEALQSVERKLGATH